MPTATSLENKHYRIEQTWHSGTIVMVNGKYEPASQVHGDIWYYSMTDPLQTTWQSVYMGENRTKPGLVAIGEKVGILENYFSGQ